MKRLFLALMLLFSLPAFAAQYTVIDLGNLGGNGQTVGHAINNWSEVVGSSPTTSSPLMAFALTDYTWVMTNLGVLPGDSFSQANAINNNGQVVGQSGTGSTIHAFSYSNGTMTDLGHLSGQTGAQAMGVNDNGQVVGISGTHAFLYSNSTMTDLGQGQATAINSNSQITGQLGTGGTGDAFLYSGGVMTDLGFAGIGFAINKNGLIVGFQKQAGGGEAFLYNNGTTTLLGFLPGDGNSSANGINAGGQIVGDSVNTTTGFQRAFLYSGGTMADLNTLIPSDSGWVLNIASGINDFGAIVGQGTLNGQIHGFRLVLSPVITSISPTSGPAGTTVTITGTNFCDPDPNYPNTFCTTVFNNHISAVKFGLVYRANGGTQTFPGSVQTTVPSDVGYGPATTAPIEVITPYANVTGPVFTVTQ